MTRNLDHRVEVTTPVLDADLAYDLRMRFERMWQDNTCQENLGRWRQFLGERLRISVACEGSTGLVP